MTDKPKHTPPPWVIERIDEDGVYEIYDEFWALVATVEKEENAELIVKAPEMYAEIETFKATYMEHLGIPPSVAHVMMLKGDITRLRAENQRLRDLLKEISTATIGRIESPYGAPLNHDCPYCLDMREMAKAANEVSNG